MVLARIILGFLTVRPMTGYDLMRAFRSSASYFWSADKAQIYRTLARLVDDGHAHTEVIPGTEAPDRIEHHITDAGRAALIEWLASDPNHQPERDAFLARIFFAGSLETAALQRVIALRRDAAQTSLESLRSLRSDAPAADSATDRSAWLRSMTLDHGIRDTEAHISWLDELQTGLNREDHP